MEREGELDLLVRLNRPLVYEPGNLWIKRNHASDGSESTDFTVTMTTNAATH